MSEPKRSNLRLRPFALADAEVVEPWLQGPGLSVPTGQVGRQWAARMLANPRILARTALLAGKAVGFARLDVGPDRAAELTLAVAPSHRRRGIGRIILAQLLEEARRNGLLRVLAVVDDGNPGACRFFLTNGFEEEGSALHGSVRLCLRLHGATCSDPLEIEV